MNKSIYLFAIALIAITSQINAQYTDVINSNRPGASYSAYAVGKNVFQVEGGLYYERWDHSWLSTKSNRYAMDVALRYGLLFEQLELIYDGQFTHAKVTDNTGYNAQYYDQNNFTKNTIGLKYLIYDPYKNPDKNKPDLYSWKANNHLQWKNLIPAVAIYAGVNLNFGDNPFYPEDSSFSPKVMLATQHHLTPNWVLVMNFAYDKFTSETPMFSYVMTLTHALRDPRYTIFIEHQGFQSDYYSDGIFRMGTARLFNKDFQLDASFGINIKDTPARFFGGIGASYRLDFHKDSQKNKDNFTEQDRKFIKDAKKNKKNTNPFEEIED